MIALVDYGAGNLTSVKKALSSLGASFTVPSTPDECRRADAVIVPGVGHFGATARLDAPWRAAIAETTHAGRPLFGICVGMQWLFEGSDEAPGVEGFASAARANVHLKVLYGRSSHHQVEAVFKAFARALRVACARDKRMQRMLPSTKGLL